MKYVSVPEMYLSSEELNLIHLALITSSDGRRLTSAEAMTTNRENSAINWGFLRYIMDELSNLEGRDQGPKSTLKLQQKLFRILDTLDK